MIVRYYLAAGALKFFSCTPLNRRFYRSVVGNCFGNKRRVKQGLHPSYINHARQLLECCRKYDAVSDGMRLLEVGTGWMHFYSIFLRLFYDVRVTLVDAWDNRQLVALKKFFSDLDNVLDAEFELSDQERSRAHGILQKIAGVGSFEELYELLDFEYAIDPTLSTLDSGDYDLIFSEGVLEHVHLTDVPEQIGNMNRVLKPGGVQFHHIGIGDHLAGYDANASAKQYIIYSERTWRMWFENVVQYVNRVQRSEFRKMFVDTGMNVLEEQCWEVDISHLKVSDRFKGYSEEDLRCGGATMVFRKSA